MEIAEDYSHQLMCIHVRDIIFMQKSSTYAPKWINTHFGEIRDKLILECYFQAHYIKSFESNSLRRSCLSYFHWTTVNNWILFTLIYKKPKSSSLFLIKKKLFFNKLNFNWRWKKVGASRKMFFWHVGMWNMWFMTSTLHLDWYNFVAFDCTHLVDHKLDGDHTFGSNSIRACVRCCMVLLRLLAMLMMVALRVRCLFVVALAVDSFSIVPLGICSLFDRLDICILHLVI